jgi:hypothetical protein
MGILSSVSHASTPRKSTCHIWMHCKIRQKGEADFLCKTEGSKLDTRTKDPRIRQPPVDHRQDARGLWIKRPVSDPSAAIHSSRMTTSSSRYPNSQETCPRAHASRLPNPSPVPRRSGVRTSSRRVRVARPREYHGSARLHRSFSSSSAPEPLQHGAQQSPASSDRLGENTRRRKVVGWHPDGQYCGVTMPVHLSQADAVASPSILGAAPRYVR